MKEIKLGQKTKKGKYCNLVALVDDADFEYLNQFHWSAVKRKNTFYVTRVFRQPKISKGVYGKPTVIYMHREIMNTPKNMECDHRDHNGLNCQRYNLRNCTHAKNNCNKLSAKNSSSKYLGIHSAIRKNGDIKWIAQIRYGDKAHHLGAFNNEIDAALAYNKAAKIHHGEFANLNKIAA